VKVVPAEVEVETVSPERETTSAATAMPKVISLETAPSPRRNAHPDVKVVLAEVEVETVSPERETTSAATAMPKDISPEIAPNPRKSALRDPDAQSLPVPPPVRPAVTAMRKVTTPVTVPPPRRRELPVLPPLVRLAATAMPKVITPATAPSPRRRELPVETRRNPRPKVVKRESPELLLTKIMMMVKMVSTVKTSLLMKPAWLTRRLAPNSELTLTLRSLRKITLLTKRPALTPTSLTL